MATSMIYVLIRPEVGTELNAVLDNLIDLGKEG